MLSMSFEISSFGDLRHVDENLDVVKELFTGLLITGFSRKKSFWSD